MNHHERRRLFFAAMRRSEMRVLRLALLHLHLDKGIDWRDIQSIEMFRYGFSNDSWMMLTSRFVTICYSVEKTDLDISDFSTYLTHVECDNCPCDVCQEERRRAA